MENLESTNTDVDAPLASADNVAIELPAAPSKEELEAIRIEKETKQLLANVYSDNITDTKDRVASILSKNINARNSDIELAWAYWFKYESELVQGGSITKKAMLQATKMSTLCRERAKIQNEYKLFQADVEVKQQRGTLEGEFKKRAIKDRAPEIKSLFTYIDETGKNQEFISVGSVWLPTFSNSSFARTKEIKQWKEYSDIKYEFHFAELRANQLERYKEFVAKFLMLFPEVSFKTIIIKKEGLGNVEEAINNLTYFLIRKGVDHEHSSNRAPLPRSLFVTIDDENEAKDALKLENIKDKLEAQKIEGLTLGNFVAVPSRGNEYIQIVDLFIGAINRKLHFPDGNGHKDELANFILDQLGLNINDYLNDQVIGDDLKMFSFLKNE